MWPDLPKGIVYAHSFKSHFSPPFDTYNNTLTVRAYIIAKGSMVYFNWGFICRPVWCPRVLGWSLNGFNLPGQADSRQGITTRLAGETWHWCSYILWYAETKTAWIDPFGHIIFLNQKVPPLRGSSPPHTLHPYRTACGIDNLVE